MLAAYKGCEHPIILFFCRNERETPNMCFSKESGVCGSKHGIMFGQITRANHREQFNDYPQKNNGMLAAYKGCEHPTILFFCGNKLETPDMRFSKESGVCGSNHLLVMIYSSKADNQKSDFALLLSSSSPSS